MSSNWRRLPFRVLIGDYTVSLNVS